MEPIADGCNPKDRRPVWMAMLFAELEKVEFSLPRIQLLVP
ncbi:MAG: hypothetical protein OXC26_15025 [Albidovulum sp.]|nr:hypothetical protein [Albidovulum sp.]